MNDPFPEITPPYPTHIPTGPGALVFFLNIGIRLVFAVAGIFALWKFIGAGFSFISSNDDPQKLSLARDKILVTFVGLLVTAILNPTIIGVER